MTLSDTLLSFCTVLGRPSKVPGLQTDSKLYDNYLSRTAEWIQYHTHTVDAFHITTCQAQDGFVNEINSRTNATIYWTTANPDTCYNLESLVVLYAKCLTTVRHDTTWVALFDMDEYIQPLIGFRKLLMNGLSMKVDWVYMIWEYVRDSPEESINTILNRPKQYPFVWRNSGKSIVRPKYFRDSRHLNKLIDTNGIRSYKANSIHRVTPLAGEYNASNREVILSRSPYVADCGSWELNKPYTDPWKCERMKGFGLVHVRTREPVWEVTFSV